MFSMLVTIVRALAATWRGLRDPEFRDALVVMLVSGTVFYAAIEGWSVIDSVYFCIMTLSTVGYGDLHPTTPLSKIFTMIFLIAGAGVFVGFVTRLAAQRRPFHFPDHGHHVDKESFRIHPDASGETKGSTRWL